MKVFFFLVVASFLLFQAALAVWVTILRFMGEMQDPKIGKEFDNTPIMSKIYDTIGRKNGGTQRGSLSNLTMGSGESPRQQNQQQQNSTGKRDTLRRKITSMTLKKKSKITKVK